MASWNAWIYPRSLVSNVSSLYLTPFEISCTSLQACKPVVHDFTPLVRALQSGPGISVSTSLRSRHSSSVAEQPVLRASTTSFWTRTGSLSFNTVYSEFLTVWLLRFVSNQTLAVRKLIVTGNRSGVLITHDVLDHFTMFSDCCFSKLRLQSDARCL